MVGVTLADPGGDGEPQFTGQMFRAMLSALEGGGGSRPFGASSGVRPNTPATVVGVTTTTWTVNPHAGILDTSASGTDGATPYAFLTAQSGAINAASASNDRVDLLCVQLSDPAEGDGTAHPQAAIVYQAGVAGAGVPSNATPRSFVLARINVPRATTGSPSVTWVSPRTVAAGGVRPCIDSSQYPATPYVGQYIDDASLGLLRWNGTAWATPTPGSGWHNVPLASGFNDDGGSAQYRSDGSGCTYLRGRIAKNTGTAFAVSTGITIANAGAIPTAMSPNRSMAYPCAQPDDGGMIRVTVGADGSLKIFTVYAGIGTIDLAGAGPWFAET